MIAQLFVGFHATFKVFHHRQCVVILGFQFSDALVQGVLVGQALFLQKLHGLCHNFEIVFREPTLIADALALGHPRLDVDQFPDGILLELRLGLAFGVCLQRGKHCRLIELVTDAVRPDELCPSGRQIAEPTTAFLDRDSVLLQEPVREIFKAHCGVQHIRDLFPQGFLCGFKLLLLGRLSSCGEGCVLTVKFQLTAPTRPILSFAHALFRAVEQVDLVQSGTLAQFHDLNTQVPHGLGCAGVLHTLTPVTGLLHIGLTFHLSCADTADHNVDVDVSRMVMPIRVSADDGGVTGEVFFAEFQAKCLCFFHGQAVVGCIAWVKADDILMALDITMLGILTILAVRQQTGRCKGEIATLKAFDDYYAGKAATENLIMKVIPETSQRSIALETGEIDLAYDLAVNDIPKINDNDKLMVYEIPSLTCWYVSMNMNKEPFNNPLVREALVMAIDRQTIIDTINAGSGQPADAIIAPAVFGYYSTGVPEYNPEKAKELLSEAGYPDGFSTTLWVNDNQSRIEMCQAIQAMLLDIGVQCSVEVLEFGSYISRTTAGEHDMAYFGWTTSSGDAVYTYYSLEHSTQQGAAGNRSFIADPDLDALIEEARSNTDESTRKDLYKDIAIMLAEINNNIPVFYSAINVGANKKVEGFVMDSNGYHNLNQVKVAQ